MEDKTLGMRWFKIYTVLFAVRVAIIAVSLVITIPLTIKNGLPSDSIEAARTVVYSIDYADIKNINSKFDPLIVNKDKTKGDKIVGTIDVKKDGYMMLTIPYEKGFVVKVDNKKVDYELVDDAFIGFAIESGKHDIEIEYKAPLKNVAIILSAVGIVALIVVSIIEAKRKI